MPEQIIYIKGSACPYDEEKISSETKMVAEEVQALESMGNDVAFVGGAAQGFTMADIEAAFLKKPSATTVIVHAHGNKKRKRHFMQAAEKATENSKNGHIWASTLYRTFAKNSCGRPLNVFMFSCGSGNGCENAVKLLPRASILVNLVEKENVSSFYIKPDAFRVGTAERGNFAEHLFLNMLCGGFETHEYYPQLSVSCMGDAESNVWQLWDDARQNGIAESSCSPILEEKIRKYLNPYLSEGIVSSAIRTIELYIKSFSLEPVKMEGTPVELHFKIDHNKFYRNVVKRGLLGPMCAIGYYANREKIGAFQTWSADEYRKKPKPPEPGLMTKYLAELGIGG